MRRLLITLGIIMVGGVLLAPSVNAGMPPKQYDHADNSMTLKQIEATKPPDTRIHRVYYGDAMRKCSEIYMRRFGLPYPEVIDTGHLLYGCEIENADGSNKEVVYSWTFWDSNFAKNVLRHELGHAWGWPSWHPDMLP